VSLVSRAGHVTKMAVTPFDLPYLNPMLHANFTALSSVKPELLSTEVLHWGNREFRSVMLLLSWFWRDDLDNTNFNVFAEDVGYAQTENDFTSRLST